VILKFQGYDDMTAARQLAGGRLVIAESDAMQLDQDEYYEYKLIGSEAITLQGQSLGRVTSLMRTGGTDLLVVKVDNGDKGEREHLIPFVDEICAEVDVAARRITIKPPEGLLELNE
jgi:16S rRNA processing protein RimM